LLTVLDGFNGLDSSSQSLLVTLGALGPVVLGIASLVGGLSAPILAVVGAIGALGIAWQQDLGRVRTITNRVFGDIQRILGNRIPALLDSVRQFWSVWGDEITLIIEGVTDILGTLLVGGIDFVVSALTGLIQLISGDFDGAFETFSGLIERTVTRLTELVDRLNLVEAFKGIISGIISAVDAFLTTTLPALFIAGLGRALGLVKSVLGDIKNVFISVFNGIIRSVADLMTELVNIAIITPLNDVISTIMDTVDALPDEVQNQLPSGIMDLTQQAELTTPDVSAATIQQQATNVQQAQATAVRDVSAAVDVNIQGDSQLAEIIRENAEIVVNEQGRQGKRQTGGPTGL
jgi:hypothetical protein